jgi:putative copper export protein
MLIVGIISELILYICFSLIVGSLILNLVPESHRPEIKVPKWILLFAVSGIALLSFIPVLRIVLYLYQDIGLGLTFKSVLLSFEIGKAWIFTFMVSLFLFMLVLMIDLKKKTEASYIGLVLVFLLILALGWASHASSLTEWSGFLTHSIHFLSVCVWLGILITVSWFSRVQHNWLQFLKWFSPVAMVCLGLTIITGLVLMSFVVDIKDYANAWMLPYGQALLIKHLLLIPLILYAFINGILAQRRVKSNPDFNPINWLKAESVIVLFIFSATAALGQQSPPHDIFTLIKNGGVSTLFDMLYQGNIYPGMQVSIVFGMTSVGLIGLALLFLSLTVFSFLKKVPVVFSFVMSILFVFTSYLSLMLAIQ